MIQGSTEELINRRRHQILLHSHLYYRLNINIISDHTFDEWSMELVKLQKDNPDASNQGVYAEHFKDFDGTSGFDLPHHLPEVASRGEVLLKSMKKIKSKQ